MLVLFLLDRTALYSPGVMSGAFFTSFGPHAARTVAPSATALETRKLRRVSNSFDMFQPLLRVLRKLVLQNTIHILLSSANSLTSFSRYDDKSYPLMAPSIIPLIK